MRHLLENYGQLNNPNIDVQLSILRLRGINPNLSLYMEVAKMKRETKNNVTFYLMIAVLVLSIINLLLQFF